MLHSVPGGYTLLFKKIVARFAAEQRRQPVEQARMPNSVTISWEKKADE